MLTIEQVKDAFHTANLEENYNFFEDDLIALANAFVAKAAPEIAKEERKACVKVVRSLNHLVADKLQEIRDAA